MSRHTPKKLPLHEAFSAGTAMPADTGASYIKFYKGIVDAIETIFCYEAASLRKTVLNHICVIEDDRLEIVFATARGLSLSPDDDSYMIEPVHRPSDRIFEEIFGVFKKFSDSDPGLTARNIYDGIYELEVWEPESALGLIEHYLASKQHHSADPSPGQLIGRSKIRGKDTAPRGVLNYIPPRPFDSGTDAQQAGRWLIESHSPYPFSLNYLRALLKQVETPPGQKALLPDELAAYRLQ